LGFLRMFYWARRLVFQYKALIVRDEEKAVAKK
jgi:hypothetical protein